MKKIYIEGMVCENCVKAVTEALENLENTKVKEVNLDGGFAIYESDKSDEVIKKAIDDIGFEPKVVESI